MKGKPLRFRVGLYRCAEGYVARVVEFPGCIARGASEREAIANVREALREFLSVAHLIGNDPVLIQVEVAA